MAIAQHVPRGSDTSSLGCRRSSAGARWIPGRFQQGPSRSCAVTGVARRAVWEPVPGAGLTAAIPALTADLERLLDTNRSSGNSDGYGEGINRE
jgi:hypothetical protein